MGTSATLLTRRQVAALLGITESEVKARDNETFHPVKGPDGSWRYPADVVANVLRGFSGVHVDQEPPGAICAAAFELFQKGTKLPDVVISLKQQPTLIRTLRTEYDSMAKTLTVGAEALVTLGKLAQSPIHDAAELVALLERLGDRLHSEYERGFKDGLSESRDFGEIVDPDSGIKRPLVTADLAIHTKNAEERWAGKKE
jgi:hypothetical protein